MGSFVSDIRSARRYRRGTGALSLAPSSASQSLVSQAPLSLAPANYLYASNAAVPSAADVASGYALPADVIDPSTGLPFPGLIDHFAFKPAGGVKEVQLRLAAWGRPLAKPNASVPYGYDGPLVPGDFGLVATDIDGTDTPRTGLAIASFKRWWNEKNPGAQLTGIPTTYDEATHYALVSTTGASTPSAPAAVPPIALPPAIPGLPSGATSPAIPGIVPLPGNIDPNNPNAPPKASPPPATSKTPYIVAGVAAAGVLAAVVIVRKKRKRH